MTKKTIERTVAVVVKGTMDAMQRVRSLCHDAWMAWLQIQTEPCDGLMKQDVFASISGDEVLLGIREVDDDECVGEDVSIACSCFTEGDT